MQSRIDQITKGLISLTVMLMFTVALIAGQARANLPTGELALDAAESTSRFNSVEIRIGDLSLGNGHLPESQAEELAKP